MPPSPAADRNLLFGILALQMDFVSRDALIAAMNAWVLDKAKPLGQILVEQGALDAGNRAWLEAGVERHLEMHGNDPQQSLAAVSSLRSVRQDLQQIADADVQASLAHVSAARPAPDPDATRADLASPAARRFRGQFGRPFPWRRAAVPGTVGGRVRAVTAGVLCRSRAEFSFEVPPCPRLLARTGTCCSAFSPCRWISSAATPSSPP